MAEADDGQPKRCSCGFWGSPSTMNMCSQCYKEYLEESQNNSANVNTTNKTASTNSTAALLSGLLAGLPTGTGNRNTQPINNTQHTSEVPQENIDNCPQQSKSVRLDVGVEETDSLMPVDLPVQKNKRRCWTCRQKLELAQRELGLCKCGYIFCLLHRLPEQHSCVFDHKVSGRQEAMKNMVETGRKKIGRSFHRMDSKPEY